MNTKHQALTVIPRPLEDSTTITLVRARARAHAQANTKLVPCPTTKNNHAKNLTQPHPTTKNRPSIDVVHCSLHHPSRNLTSLTANPDSVLMRLAWERRGGGGGGGEFSHRYLPHANWMKGKHRVGSPHEVSLHRGFCETSCWQRGRGRCACICVCVCVCASDQTCKCSVTGIEGIAWLERCSFQSWERFCAVGIGSRVL